MKELFALVLCSGIISLSIGCQSTKTRATEGSIIGTVLGAGAGYVIGKQSGHGSEGAGIGAAVGLLSGAAIGSQINKPGAGQQASGTTQGTSANQMSIQQIVDLSKQGVNEAVIADKIQLSNSRFNLTSDDIAYLQQQGVSQRVIDAMQGR